LEEGEDLMSSQCLLAIDQGTTSTRAVVYEVLSPGQEGYPDCQVRGQASAELSQHYPRPGWVEHDGKEIWQGVAGVVPAALADAGIEAGSLAAVAVTNQRETALIWDRETGAPLARALVWQDRRTAPECRERQADEGWISARTGLVIDPYFSATKLRWLLDQEPGWRARAEAGKLAGGTVDSFLLWHLTGGQVFASDQTNASRTLLLGLQTADWDEELCRYWNIPRALLPEVRPSAGDFGVTRGLEFLPDGIPIRGVAGDQQAALFGQCAFAPGEAKCTYGTGAFYLQHLGDQLILPRPVSGPRPALLTTLAAGTGDLVYALEGSVFIAGAAVQWLRDGLGLVASAPDVEGLAQRSDPEQPVLFVPGLVGLGAPYWVPEARGALFGLTRGTSAADLGRAALEGVAYQITDLVEACRGLGQAVTSLRVDGGMAQNAWFLQAQANLLGLPVLQAVHHEATARGVAYLAGLGAGIWPDTESLRGIPAELRAFHPNLEEAERARRLAQWRRAVAAVIAFYQDDQVTR
jgi:glycerol kinase